MTAPGFRARLARAGFGDPGVATAADEKRATLVRLPDDLFAAGTRDDRIARLRAADTVAAPINALLRSLR